MNGNKRTAQEIFLAAAPTAARLLIQMMKSDDATVAQRLSCAESVLSRAMGKAGASAASQPETVEVLLAEDAKECAQ